jgi:hypothetical protein
MGARSPKELGSRVHRPLAAGIGALAVGILLIIASQAQAAGVVKAPGSKEVTLGFDKVEPGRLVSAGIPVDRGTKPAVAAARTIYSVRLPHVRPGQELLVRGTVALTRCDESDLRPGGGAHEGTLDSPCESVGSPYALPGGGHYDPRIGVRAFLGDERSDLGRGLGHWQVGHCSIPLHHCPLQVQTSFSHLKRRSGSLRLNLAVTAFSPKARLGARGRAVDVIELDGDCKNHDFNPCAPVLESSSSNTHGELKAIRFGSSRNPARRQTTQKRINSQLRVQGSRNVTKATQPRIIVRKRLGHLSPGDVIDAQASFHLRDRTNDGYVFRHEVSGLLFLSSDPSALQPGSKGRWIAATARTNCPQRSGCEIKKVGATTVPEGAPKTMWVIYVGSARDSGGQNGAPLDVMGADISVSANRAASGLRSQ